MDSGSRRAGQRASDAWAALRHEFYVPARGLFRETAGSDQSAFHWPYSQALAAAISVAALAGNVNADAINLAHAAASRYWTPRSTPPSFSSSVQPPLGPGGDSYYDDNAWTALELLRIHRLTGNSTALQHAAAVFNFLVGGWDDNPKHPAPGGVFWVDAPWNRDRNTVSNAPSALVGLRLFEVTGKRHYLEWARQMLTWVDSHLRAPDGLYWDRISITGEVERTRWSYNQGTMLGAHALLYRLTGESEHLQRATEIADAARAEFTLVRLRSQPLAFNAIYLRHLLLLHAETGDEDLLQPLVTYGEHLWYAQRDPSTNLVVSSQPLPLIDQAAFTQVLAMLDWDAGIYGMMA